jgi:cell division protein FtsQ
VKGHTLEEVHIIAAAPAAVRKYLASAKYGEDGVVLTTNTGIEIRFGDGREAMRKWEAAAQVLADPSVTLLSYVDVTAPNRPAVGGEDHELPHVH